ncbi:MAG: hypothetical protein QNJ05_15345 [Woeseiaceae bacterium]|nr:hypothetical protein [Woeseiaceae bacterium]
MKHMYELLDRVHDVEKKIDAMTLRERLLIGITALTLITGVWYVMFLEPLVIEADRKTGELAALEERINVANSSLEQQVAELAGGSADQRARIAKLDREIAAINETLGDYAAELVDPAEMTQVLEGVLRKQSALSLVRIRNLPSETLAASEDEDATRFYRHGIEIEVEGSFFAVVDYLNDVEALPWRLYWQILELDVVEYPRNRIRIEVSTLSLDEEWIGA